MEEVISTEVAVNSIQSLMEDIVDAYDSVTFEDVSDNEEAKFSLFAGGYQFMVKFNESEQKWVFDTPQGTKTSKNFEEFTMIISSMVFVYEYLLVAAQVIVADLEETIGTKLIYKKIVGSVKKGYRCLYSLEGVDNQVLLIYFMENGTYRANLANIENGKVHGSIAKYDYVSDEDGNLSYIGGTEDQKEEQTEAPVEEPSEEVAEESNEEPVEEVAEVEEPVEETAGESVEEEPAEEVAETTEFNENADESAENEEESEQGDSSMSDDLFGDIPASGVSDDLFESNNASEEVQSEETVEESVEEPVEEPIEEPVSEVEQSDEPTEEVVGDNDEQATENVENSESTDAESTENAEEPAQLDEEPTEAPVEEESQVEPYLDRVAKKESDNDEISYDGYTLIYTGEDKEFIFINGSNPDEVVLTSAVNGLYVLNSPYTFSPDTEELFSIFTHLTSNASLWKLGSSVLQEIMDKYKGIIDENILNVNGEQYTVAIQDGVLYINDTTIPNIETFNDFFGGTDESTEEIESSENNDSVENVESESTEEVESSENNDSVENVESETTAESKNTTVKTENTALSVDESEGISMNLDETLTKETTLVKRFENEEGEKYIRIISNGNIYDINPALLAPYGFRESRIKDKSVLEEHHGILLDKDEVALDVVATVIAEKPDEIDDDKARIVKELANLIRYK